MWKYTMPFDWNEYYDLAKQLAKESGEAQRRSAISRAYYAAYWKARELLEVFEVDIDPHTPMRTLTVALCQIVEIVKNTTEGARVVLLDEPTSAVDADAARVIETAVRTLANERGIAVLWVSHDLAQVERLADRVFGIEHGHCTGIRPR